MTQLISVLSRFNSRAFKALLVVVLLCSAPAAFSHQQKLAYITVLFNPNTNNIEVMHRFSLHDAEHAVHEIFGKDADIISSESTQETFVGYITGKFSLQATPSKLVPLETVGYEIDGRYFWVYQETPIPKTINKVRLSHDALREIWPDQVNRVNIELGKSVKTLIFGESVRSLSTEIKLKFE